MMKKRLGLRTIILLLFILLVLVVCQYLLCIPINIHSGVFLLEFSILLVAIVFHFAVFRKYDSFQAIKADYLVYAVMAVFAIMLVFSIIGSPYTGGLGNYKNQSVIKEVDFETIPEFDVSQVQLVDKNTAIQLGDRVFGTLGSDEVSQFEIGSDWNQISYKGNLYRVTPIEFGGLFKYFITRSTPGYIMVDCENGDAKLVRSEDLKYTKKAYFNHNIYRHIFLHDPFALLGEPRFELDDNQKPYWVTPVYKVTFVGKTRDVKGIYITDPSSGNIEYYDKQDAPGWVDNIYPVNVVYTQFAQSKRYENGLFNWSKKGIVEFTDDYAYVQFDDNVYIYTGVTSVGKDESNVGFAYVNLRNGEISYIRRAGAEEYSARSSAQGAVQQYNYTAIFPSMVNINNTPTYFMGLVDGANLIKNYAFVSYENYQTVATGVTVDEAYKNYIRLIGKANDVVDDDFVEKEVVVENVQTIVKDGNSIVLILDNQGNIYHYDLSNGDYSAPFIKVGDTVKISVNTSGSIKQFND